MAVPNLIGHLLLAPMVFKVTREYFDAKKQASSLGRSSGCGTARESGLGCLCGKCL